MNILQLLHGAMNNWRTWKHLKANVYHWDGSWRDIYVQNCSQQDWIKWTNFINLHYKLNFYNPTTDNTEETINFDSIKDALENGDYVGSTVSFYIHEDIQVNVHFFDKNQIEHDIDPREFDSIEKHNLLLDYMKKISDLLSKAIILTEENHPEQIHIKVENGKVLYVEQ